MGGFIAIKLAIEYPEILDKLVLIGTNARNISQKEIAFRKVINNLK